MAGKHGIDVKDVAAYQVPTSRTGDVSGLSVGLGYSQILIHADHTGRHGVNTVSGFSLLGHHSVCASDFRFFGYRLTD